MKMNFYLSIFLLLICLPFFLLEYDYPKTETAEFVFSNKKEKEEKDSLRIFEVIEGKEDEYFFRFNENNHNKAYFLKDSISIDLTTPGAFGGYYLSIKLSGENYKTELVKSGCTWFEKLKIQEQFLKFENFELIHGRKLKGDYFCQAKPKNDLNVSIDQVNIRGHFELDLVDVEEERKLFE